MNEDLKLEEGEVICPKCDGGGSYPKKFAMLEDPYFFRCLKCGGNGKLDWVQLVMKPKPFREFIKVRFPKSIARDLGIAYAKNVS